MIRHFLTVRDSADRLTEQAPLTLDSRAESLPSVWIDSTKKFQELEGFGAAFTEAGATTWLALSPQKRDQVIRDYFSVAAGHGYSFCRVHMNSCDFSLGNYSHAENPLDLVLKHFSIDRDRQALLPMIKAAMAMAEYPIKLLASPWSPPAWMKSNGQMNQGGKLLPEYAHLWARCFVKFIQAYRRECVPIWGVSVQNEPAATQTWDSCIYTAQEERDFVRDHLGPALSQAGLGDVKVVIWDHNRDLMVERAGTVYSDPEAAKYVWGTGFHWYGEDHFDHVQLVHDAWPEKKLLFTEGCQEGGPHEGSWDLGERYARSMINDLNRWTAGWIDWNLVLDERGGPNHVGNFCSAPILIDASNDALLHQSSYYYMGHFTRFAKPGALRVLCASSLQAIEATAFLNPGVNTVVVAMNRTNGRIKFRLTVDDQSVTATLPAHSIATYVSSRKA